MTFVSNMIGISSGAIQVRPSEALNMYLFGTMWLREIVSAVAIKIVFYFALLRVPQFQTMNASTRKITSAIRAIQSTKSAIEMDKKELEKGD